MSLVTRLQQFTPSCPIDVAEWNPIELVLYVCPQLPHHPLHHPGQGVGPQILETGRSQIEHNDEQQETMQTAEVDSRAAVMQDSPDDDVSTVAEKFGTEDGKADPS